MQDIRIHNLSHPDEISKGREIRAKFGPSQMGTSVGIDRLVHKNGNIIWCETSRVPILAPDGNVTHLMAVRQDITERKRAEVIKSEFIATVSHELRTPLTSIKGSLGILRSGILGDVTDKIRSVLDISHRNCDRLEFLINDILDLEKIEAGQLDLDKKPLDVSSLVEKAIEANQGYGIEHGVSFVITQTVPDKKIEVDEDRMMQVLSNLMSNAAKFSPAGSKVELSCTARDSMVRVTVTDHGHGIPEDFQDQLFEKFAQADSSDNRQKGGTGLGLSIAKAIVEQHRGILSYKSEMGKGSSFYVELPVFESSLNDRK